MLNNASKFALGVAGVATVAAIFADDRAGVIVLIGLVLAAAAIALGTGRTIGADLAPFVSTDAPAVSSAVDPSDVGEPSVGPLLLAAGVTVVTAAGALGSDFLIVGALLSVVGGGVWLFDTFRTPGVIPARDAANVDSRLLGPLALPLVSTIVAITIAYSFSRVLLAVNETASWVVALIVAAMLFGLFYVIAEKTPTTKVLSGLAGAGAVITLVAGGTFAGIGPREFHDAGEELPSVEITAKDIAFDRKVIALPADTDVEVVFNNQDLGVFHNVAFYTADEPGTPIYNGLPSSKGTLKYQFETPNVGTYRYVCDFHPSMVGEFRVTEATAESEDNGESPKAKDDEPNTPVSSSSEKEPEH